MNKKFFSSLKSPSTNIIYLMKASFDFIQLKCKSDPSFAHEYESYILNNTNLKKGDISND